jgi:hypothetical protein
MSAHTTVLGMLAATALSLPSDTPCFTFDASGAVSLSVTSDEASYGLIPERVNEARVLAISLGATRAQGSLTLYTQGDHPPRPGRYPVHFSWDEQADGGPMFHACFIAGTPERPLGYFHGESGWVTIDRVQAGQISGEFELQARGSLAADMNDEDQWVTVRGSFVAERDSTIADVRTASSEQ